MAIPIQNSNPLTKIEMGAIEFEGAFQTLSMHRSDYGCSLTVQAVGVKIELETKALLPIDFSKPVKIKMEISQ